MKAVHKLVLTSLLALSGASAYAGETIGVVTRAKGDVRIERDGEHIPARRGTVIEYGDRLITGPTAHASVNMQRGGPISIGPGTDASLDRFAADERPTVKRAPPAILQGLASYFAVNRQR
jgi:hypothetical protein